MKKIINISLTATTLFLFTACTSSDLFVPTSPSYKLGEQDGCSTAEGTYKKDSEAFNNDKDYEKGWFAGRKNCNPVNSK